MFMTNSDRVRMESNELKRTLEHGKLHLDLFKYSCVCECMQINSIIHFDDVKELLLMLQW